VLNEPGTKVPALNVRSVKTLRANLVRRFSLFVGRPADGVHMQMLADSICTELPRASRVAALETVRPLAGSELRVPALAFLAARVAGNARSLSAGLPVLLTNAASIEKPDYSVLYISRVTALKEQPGKKQMYELALDSYCGATAGMTWGWPVSRAMLKVVASRIGFSAPWGNFPLHDPAQVSGLYVYATVSGSAASKDPRVTEVHAANNVITMNRDEVLKLRCRFKTSCPNGVQVACHQCGIGRDSCAAATHELSYGYITCHKCHNAQAIADPEINPTVCITCDRAQSKGP